MAASPSRLGLASPGRPSGLRWRANTSGTLLARPRRNRTRNVANSRDLSTSIIGVALTRPSNQPILAPDARPMTETLKQPATATAGAADGTRPHSLLVADIIIANAPDPVFVSDLEGKILQA